MGMRNVTEITITPQRHGVTGFEPCKKHDATSFAVHYFGTAPSYGEGWFPAYDTNMKYHFPTLQQAIDKATEFQRHWNLGHVSIQIR